MMTKTKPIGQVHLRWAEYKDHPEILEIENLCFQHPWGAKDLKNYQRDKVGVVVVAEFCDMIAGYACYSVAHGCVQIDNLAVAPRMQHKGIGTELVQRLKRRASATMARRLVAYVQESNLGALLFFKKMGFEWVQTLHDYYSLSDDDAYKMEWRRA